MNRGHLRPVSGDVTKRFRPILAGTLTVTAAVLVFVALVVPDQLARVKPGQFVPGAFLRIPFEGIVGAAVLLIVPARARKLTAVLIGLGIGLLTVLKLINMGFLTVLARRFDPVLDWPLLGDGYNYLVETSGQDARDRRRLRRGRGGRRGVRRADLGGAAVVRDRRPPPPRRDPGGPCHDRRLGRVRAGRDDAVPVLAGRLGHHPQDGQERRADGAQRAAGQEAVRRRGGRGRLRERARRRSCWPGCAARTSCSAWWRATGGPRWRTRRWPRRCEPALAASAAELTAAGFSARSAYLTSSTYGGGSWLAHATFQSGLWIDHQQRYRQLTAGSRLTLTKAFQKADWHTVGIEPGNTHAWPEAGFYGYDEVYDSRNLGYNGPAVRLVPDARPVRAVGVPEERLLAGRTAVR